MSAFERRTGIGGALVRAVVSGALLNVGCKHLTKSSVAIFACRPTSLILAISIR
jgi:hypothetical protein